MDRKGMLAVGIWIPGLLALVGGFWFFSSEQRAARTCDDAIRAGLIAPATYKRISTDGLAGEPPMMGITYEADNRLGVPLRATGVCILNFEASAAVWREASREP